jgi:uncharacterized protein YodC (DUF2158 family)
MDLKAGGLGKLIGRTMAIEKLGVGGLANEDTVWCVWFEKGEVRRDSFPPVVLDKVDYRGVRVDFKEGDWARLISGGSLMAVEQVGKGGLENEDLVWCMWFNQKGEVRRDSFPPVVLEQVENSYVGRPRIRVL